MFENSIVHDLTADTWPDKFQAQKLDLTDITLFERVVRVPVAYLKGYNQINCYPNLFPGVRAYGDIIEQRVAATLVGYYFYPEWDLIDIGAGCGVYSILGAIFGRKVYAFEPADGIFELLQHNTSNKHVIAYKVGLTDNPEITQYGGRWGTFNIRLSSEDSPDSVQINMAQLDDFELKADVIKLDVEGFGGKVLKGGLDTLTSAQVIVIEIHDRDEYQDCIGIIEAIGWKWQHITQSHILAVRGSGTLLKDFESKECLVDARNKILDLTGKTLLWPYASSGKALRYD